MLSGIAGAITEFLFRVRPFLAAPSELVLLYHRVEPRPRPDDPLSVSVADLEAHLEILSREGIEVVGCDELLEPRGSLRRVHLAFDDGYASAAAHCPPVLRRYGARATFFIVPGAMGGTSEWELALGSDPAPLMTWEDLERLLASGMSVGSHSWSHADLSRSSTEELESEIVRAKEEIARRIGVHARGFSVPFGRDDPRIDAVLARSGHGYKITNREVPATQREGLLIRPCAPVLNGESLRTFRQTIAGADRWLHRVRRIRKRIRGTQVPTTLW